MKELSFDEIIDIIINNIEKYGVVIENTKNHKFKNSISFVDSKNILYTRNKSLSHFKYIAIYLYKGLFNEIRKFIEKNLNGSRYIRFYDDKNGECEEIVINNEMKDEKIWNFIKDFVRKNRNKIRKIIITVDKVNENSNVVRIGDLFIRFEGKKNILNAQKYVYATLFRRFYRGGVYLLDDFDVVKELL